MTSAFLRRYPGRFNAITEVAGVEVGNKTLVSGEGKLIVGKGRRHAILRRGRLSTKSVFATSHDFAAIPDFRTFPLSSV